MEVVLNHYCDIKNLKTNLRVFKYGNTWKTKKFGSNGIWHLMKEFSQVAYIWLLLRIK